MTQFRLWRLFNRYLALNNDKSRIRIYTAETYQTQNNEIAFVVRYSHLIKIFSMYPFCTSLLSNIYTISHFNIYEAACVNIRFLRERAPDNAGVCNWHNTSVAQVAYPSAPPYENVGFQHFNFTFHSFSGRNKWGRWRIVGGPARPDQRSTRGFGAHSLQIHKIVRGWNAEALGELLPAPECQAHHEILQQRPRATRCYQEYHQGSRFIFFILKCIVASIRNLISHSSLFYDAVRLIWMRKNSNKIFLKSTVCAQSSKLMLSSFWPEISVYFSQYTW